MPRNPHPSLPPAVHGPAAPVVEHLRFAATIRRAERDAGVPSSASARVHLAMATGAKDHAGILRWFEEVQTRDLANPLNRDACLKAIDALRQLIARPADRRPGFDPPAIRAWLDKNVPRAWWRWV